MQTDFHWQQLTNRYAQKKLPHALLLAGEKNIDKLQFAKNFAQYVLCEKKLDNQACKQCRSCHWFSVGTHPDFLLIETSEEEPQIKIETIRALIERLHKTSQCGGYTVVIISPAEAMNVSSSNALLKILEEPPADILFMLVTHQKFLLPATIRSRCQTLHFHDLMQVENKNEYFEMLDKLSEPFKLAAEWQKKFELDEILVHMMQYIKSKIIANLQQQKSCEALYQFLDYLFETRKFLNQKINFNQSLLVENLFTSLLQLRNNHAC